jgi:hypothetical protein
MNPHISIALQKSLVNIKTLSLLFRRDGLHAREAKPK